jgi:hypothetical protein
MMMEVEKITELCREYPEIAACVVQPDGGLIRIGI